MTNPSPVRIECSCSVHNGAAAMITADRAVGITPTMVHNYVSYVGGPLAAAMGVSPVEGA